MALYACHAPATRYMECCTEAWVPLFSVPKVKELIEEGNFKETLSVHQAERETRKIRNGCTSTVVFA